MVTISTAIADRAVISAPPEAIWPLVSDIRGLGTLIPKVGSIEDHGAAWQLTLEETTALGFTVRPRFDVAFTEDPPSRLSFVRHGDGGDGAATGAITLERTDHGTEVAFALDIDLTLSIPRLLKKPAKAIIDREMAGMARGFLTNLQAAVTAGSA